MFIDHVHIRVTGGAGGKGCCSFRREKYVPLGGPDGGDGGNGGDVIIAASSRLTSLLDLLYHSHFKGERGVHGKGSDCHGRRGEPLVIQVPCGTVVRDKETNELLADLVEEGQQFVAAKGGRGGRGNPRFATAANRAPSFAEKGEPGEDREFLLELKVIAEVGLVGLPNAGKSTLLSVISAATPKIADYPFTTLSPNLGVVGLDGYRTLTVADIPGIIEGAAQGKGLGHDFLRHIERTRVLLFLIDLGDEDPVATRIVLENELSEYSPVFVQRPRVYAFNKTDITENRERIDAIRKQFPDAWFISGVTREGLDELLEHLWQLNDVARREEQGEVVDTPEREYTFAAPYTIERTPSGFVVEGARVVRALRMTDFDNPEAVQHLQDNMRKMGLFKALKRMGAHPGDMIHIDETELEYQPD
jgi:GTP-binding protein